MNERWEEIKKLELPKPTYIKTVAFRISRNLRRVYKLKNPSFICPKDKTGGICYTCSRKG